MVRNLFNFDQKRESCFWYVVKDNFGGFDELSSRDRGKVRKAYKTFDIRKISKDYLIQNGWKVYIKAAEHYKVKADIPTREGFLKRMEGTDDTYDFWGCIDKETGQLAAFSINHVINDFVDYQTLKAHPAYLQKYYPFYGLFFEMNRYYLGEKGVKYVSDGARSLTEHSNIQPFLIERFGFRKAYCQINIVYKEWFGILVCIAFPFRNLIPIRSLKSLLKMEELHRISKKENGQQISSLQKIVDNKTRSTS